MDYLVNKNVQSIKNIANGNLESNYKEYKLNNIFHEIKKQIVEQNNEDDNLEIHSEDPDSSTLIIASNNYKETDILDNIK